MIITHGKQQFVIGMTWSLHSSLKEVKQTLKDNARNALVQVETARGSFDGSGKASGKQTQIGVYQGAIKGKAMSLALAVGLVEHNCTVMHMLPDDMVLVMAISGGLPLPGRGEQIVNAKQADVLVREALAHSQTLIAVQSVGGVRTLEQVLDTFLQQMASGQLTKKSIAPLYLKRSASPIARVATFTTILAIPALGFLGYTAWQSQEAARLRERLNLDQAARSRQLSQQQAAQLQAAKEQFERDLAQKRQELAEVGGLLERQWLVWNDAARSLPLSVAGYVPNSLECTRAACTVKWEGQGKFIKPSDKEKIPHWVADGELGPQATSKFALPPVKGMAAHPMSLDEKAMRIAIYEAIQPLVPTIQVEPVAPVLVSPPQGVPLPPAVAGSVGRLRLNLGGPTALVMANDVMQRLASWPVVLKTLSWNQVTTGGPSIAIEAEYVHVQSRQ